MKAQTWVFIGLIAIVGFIFYKTNGSEGEVNPLKNKPAVVSEDETPTEANGKNDKKLDDEVLEEKEESNEPEETTDDTKEEENINEEESNEPVVKNIEGQTFSSYTNKAIGYTIDRPDNWYWQHLFAPEFENELEVIDILAINRSPLPDEIAYMYTTSIVIDVVKKTPPTPDGNKTSLMIAEKQTKRYEANTSITYLIEVGNGNTIRLIYTTSEANEKEKAIFENIVASLSL